MIKVLKMFKIFTTVIYQLSGKTVGFWPYWHERVLIIQQTCSTYIYCSTSERSHRRINMQLIVVSG